MRGPVSAHLRKKESGRTLCCLKGEKAQLSVSPFLLLGGLSVGLLLSGSVEAEERCQVPQRG